ncbi:MAG: MarR family winged helix-turn-helix transcriptional regulator [Formivibrio sp.]|nr:MarR family winged helix-turn-helix transcriptional regulator [Formivibrio sp.]
MNAPDKVVPARSATPKEDLVLALGDQLSALLSASRAMTAETAALFHPELPRASFHIARWLYAFGPAKASRVADALSMDRSASSRLTSKLVEQGLVEVRADSLDGRSIVLELTANGRNKMCKAIHHKGDSFRHRVEKWSATDLEQLTLLLRRFNDEQR